MDEDRVERDWRRPELMGKSTGGFELGPQHVLSLYRSTSGIPKIQWCESQHQDLCSLRHPIASVSATPPVKPAKREASINCSEQSRLSILCLARANKKSLVHTKRRPHRLEQENIDLKASLAALRTRMQAPERRELSRNPPARNTIKQEAIASSCCRYAHCADFTMISSQCQVHQTVRTSP